MKGNRYADRKPTVDEEPPHSATPRLATVVVVAGLLAGLGAFGAEPGAGVRGAAAGEALVLPADARFVMGFDVKRFTTSRSIPLRVAARDEAAAFSERGAEDRARRRARRDQIIVLGDGRRDGR